MNKQLLESIDQDKKLHEAFKFAASSISDFGGEYEIIHADRLNPRFDAMVSSLVIGGSESDPYACTLTRRYIEDKSEKFPDFDQVGSGRFIPTAGNSAIALLVYGRSSLATLHVDLATTYTEEGVRYMTGVMVTSENEDGVFMPRSTAVPFFAKRSDESVTPHVMPISDISNTLVRDLVSGKPGLRLGFGHGM